MEGKSMKKKISSVGYKDCIHNEKSKETGGNNLYREATLIGE
jgi:hypothetical protein